MSFYQRRLPHWQPDAAFIFLTWRLYGSWVPDERLAVVVDTTEGRKFLLIDRSMDLATSGPLWLRDSRVAGAVVETLKKGEAWQLYELFAWAVMANHVHVLLRPLKPLADVTRFIKKMSSREANLILNRVGTPFWQMESYDHWVRDEAEFDRIVKYIVDNPVRAGLVARAEAWRWSSAFLRKTD